ncbi:MAG: helix-turn-helix transcriptional regulator [Nocardioides sp.]
MAKSDQTHGHLDTLILSALKGRPAHGYDVIAELRSRSDGGFDLPEGTVYPALHRLERQGLVSSTWAVEGGRRRRVYRITGAGATALSTATREWRQFSLGMNAVLGGA